MTQRLQKLISAAGLASRRGAEALIAAGRVTVNGRTASLGESADPDTDEVRLDGQLIRADARRRSTPWAMPRCCPTRPTAARCPSWMRNTSSRWPPCC